MIHPVTRPITHPLTQPAQHLVNTVHFRTVCFRKIGQRRTVDHQHRQLQLAGRYQLGRRAFTAGVLTHNPLDTMAPEQCQVACRGERPPVNDDGTVEKRQGTGRLVNQPQQIVMLRLVLKRLQVLATDGQHDPLAGARQSLHGRFDVSNLLPAVACNRLPGRAGECQQGNAALRTGQDRVLADLPGKRMGGVNKMGEALEAQKVCKTFRPAEAAGTNRYRLGFWRSDAAGIAVERRQMSIGQGSGQCPGFGGTAEDQDFYHG